MVKGKNTTEKDLKKADSMFNTCHWLISAFALTITFLVFEMQAYTIPTGSMADTLKGAHFRLRCSQCGFRYDYDFRSDVYKLAATSMPYTDVPVRPWEPRCPSCGYYELAGEMVQSSAGRRYLVSTGRDKPVISGDRIFVFKAIYQFFEPERWDVTVFKDPRDPRINYIKRMIALPGETVEIIDGDVYIDGLIARKPPAVQRELWLEVYDNNYKPSEPESMRFNGHQWRNPFVNSKSGVWDLEGQGGTVFTLDSDRINTIYYDTSIGNDFRATHSYDDSRRFRFMPVCSDLMVRFDVEFEKYGKTFGVIGASLSKYGIEYEGVVDTSDLISSLSIRRVAGGDVTELARLEFPVDKAGQGQVSFEFMNVDHMLILKYGDMELRHDLGRGPDDAGSRNDVMPELKIFARGKAAVYNLRVYRDLHYLSSTIGDMDINQAGEGEPFELMEDEYFVMGDNTPASLDSRLWARPGVGNNGKQYRQGVVPRDYLVGKAFVVYWPGSNNLFSESEFLEGLEKLPKPLGTIFHIIRKPVPYLKGMKFIAGGSDKSI